jgi:tetratricopeptide (TPR) repeat protein
VGGGALVIDHEQIERLLEVNRLNEAGLLIERGLAQVPDDPYLHYCAARLAFAREDYASADEHVGHVLSADPQNFSARLLHFVLLRHAKKHAEAELVITGLIRENPASAELLALYGQLMLCTLHVDKAEALVREALRLDSESQQARLCAVLVACVRGRASESREALADLVAEDPEGFAVAHTLLLVLVEQGRYRDALGLARELLRADPANAHLVDLVIELRALSHWIALPAYPVHRFGGAAAGVMWVLAVVLGQVARSTGAVWLYWVLGVYVAYCVYTWVYPPLLKRWLRARGA